MRGREERRREGCTEREGETEGEIKKPARTKKKAGENMFEMTRARTAKKDDQQKRERERERDQSPSSGGLAVLLNTYCEEKR